MLRMYSMMFSLRLVKIYWRDQIADSVGFDSLGYCWNLGRVRIEAVLYYCDVSGAEMRWPNGRIRLRHLPLREPGLSGRLLELQ